VLTWKVITLFHIDINIYSFFDLILRSIVIPFLSLLDSFFDFIYSILFYFILCCSSCFYFVFLLLYSISFLFILFYFMALHPILYFTLFFHFLLFYSLLRFTLSSHFLYHLISSSIPTLLFYSNLYSSPSRHVFPCHH
jgi:hypothetical protein